jgi:hypothetical protein
MSNQQVPVIYQHADHPEWGRGIVLPPAPGRDDRLDLSFETGGRRVLLRRFSSKLVRADVTAHEASVLGEKLAVRKTAGPPIKVPRKRKATAPPAVIPDFSAQVRLFERLYPGGFRGEKYMQEERGTDPKKKGEKGTALTTAAQRFRPAAFDASPADVFACALDLARNSGFVHPLDGTTTLGALDESQRTQFVTALGELLHGSAPEAERFNRFIASMGATAKPSWPLVTMFQALVSPAAHVCVKPTAFQKQAALMGVPVAYAPRPAAAIYAEFLAVARATEAALRKAGQAPRDLVDVHSFICLTHGARVPAEALGANAA